MSRREGNVLAFDFGTRYIGVAVATTLTGTARGLTTIAAKNGKPSWHEIAPLIDDYDPVLLVVGRPLNMDGTSFEMTDRAASFAAALKRRYQREVTSWDERLTSKEAGWERDAGRSDGRGKTDHEHAACLIVESYLRDNPQDLDLR